MATKAVEGPMTIDEVKRRDEDRQPQGGNSRPPKNSSTGAWSAPPTPAGGARPPRLSSASDQWATVSGRGSAKSSSVKDQVPRSASSLTHPVASPVPRAVPVGSGRTLPKSIQTSAQSSLFRADKPDISKIRTEIRAAIKELCLSRDTQEALQRVKELRLPTVHQAAELAHILVQIAEEGNRESRVVCFSFAVQLFQGGIFSKSELLPGLEKFFNTSYQELCSDVPALPEIVQSECLPALEELVRGNLLTAQQHEAFVKGVQQ